MMKVKGLLALIAALPCTMAAWATDYNGAAVNIIGGTVVAKAGKDDTGYRAIGAGKGSDSYGSLDIDDLMMVRAERIAAAVERHDMCWYRTNVRVEPCTHPGYTADTCPYHKH